MKLQAAVRALVALVAVASLASGCTYTGQETYTFESTVEPAGVLTVTSLNGSVLLQRDPTATRVHGTLTVRASGYDSTAKARAATRDVSVLETGDAAALDLAVLLPAGARRENFGVDFDLFVPPNVTVSAITNDGAILIDTLPASTLSTTHGQVELRFTRGDAVVRTYDAPVVVDGHEGLLDVRTTNAPLDLYSVVGDIRASTINGFITCRALPPYGAELSLATTNAGIDLTLPYDFGAGLVATTTDGNIYVEGLDFYATYDVPGQLEGELYDGAGFVDVRTNNADIAIHARR